MATAMVEGKDGVRRRAGLALARLARLGTGPRGIVAGVLLLGIRAIGGAFHPLDTASSTIIAVTVALLTGIGVMSWNQAHSAVPRGTLILFAVGIALGTLLVQTRGAAWRAGQIVDLFALRQATPFMAVAVMAAVLVVVHLGFASATARAAAFIPIVISALQEVSRAGVPVKVVGLAMILQFSISLGFVLVVSVPRNMAAYGSGTFAARDFTRAGVVITVIGYALVLPLTATWWDGLGYVRG